MFFDLGRMILATWQISNQSRVFSFLVGWWGISGLASAGRYHRIVVRAVLGDELALGICLRIIGHGSGLAASRCFLMDTLWGRVPAACGNYQTSDRKLIICLGYFNQVNFARNYDRTYISNYNILIHQSKVWLLSLTFPGCVCQEALVLASVILR